MLFFVVFECAVQIRQMCWSYANNREP